LCDLAVKYGHEEDFDIFRYNLATIMTSWHDGPLSASDIVEVDRVFDQYEQALKRYGFIARDGRQICCFAAVTQIGRWGIPRYCMSNL
jgi:hypothetical protein